MTYCANTELDKAFRQSQVFEVEPRAKSVVQIEACPEMFAKSEPRVNLPITSPIYELQFLEKGWDDPQTLPLSVKTLKSAEYIWQDVRLKSAAGKPCVEPGPGGFVEFSWNSDEPDKRLVMWVYGDSKFSVEYSLERNGEEVESGEVTAHHEAVSLVDKYIGL
jgi:hypothetical protein